jgi:2-oxoglutarate dehydrogenase E2 component (dihydrolipoamide succinyltransferase)
MTADGVTGAAGTQPAAAPAPKAAAPQQPPGADEAQLFIDPATKAAPAPAADSKQPAQKEPELVVDPPAFTGDRPQGLPAAVAEVAEAAAAQAAAEAVPVKGDKPKLPAGVEADVGNGLVSEPIGWWVHAMGATGFMQCCV